MNWLVKWSLIGLGQLAVLLIGWLLIESLVSWGSPAGRPNSGMYYGHVDATVSDALLSFRMEGRTEPRWQWRSPSTYVYPSVTISCYGQDGAKHTAELDLRLMEYRSNGDAGPLTKDVLARWLLGDRSRHASSRASAAIDTIWLLIADAANGSLPRPGHHPYCWSTPPFTNISHSSCCKFGVSYATYVWFAVWCFLVFAYRRSSQDRQRSPTPRPPSLTSGPAVGRIGASPESIADES